MCFKLSFPEIYTIEQLSIRFFPPILTLSTTFLMHIACTYLRPIRLVIVKVLPHSKTIGVKKKKKKAPNSCTILILFHSCLKMLNCCLPMISHVITCYYNGSHVIIFSLVKQISQV